MGRPVECSFSPSSPFLRAFHEISYRPSQFSTHGQRPSASGSDWPAWAAPSLLAAALANGAPNAEKLGWRLGCQAWSFKQFTFFEAIDKTASLGLHYIEAGPGQKSQQGPAEREVQRGFAGRRRQRGQEEAGRLGRQAGQLRRFPFQGRRPMPQDVRLRQGHGHRDDCFRAVRRTLSTPSTSCATSTGSTSPSTTIPSPRTTGTPIPC